MLLSWRCRLACISNWMEFIISLHLWQNGTSAIFAGISFKGKVKVNQNRRIKKLLLQLMKCCLTIFTPFASNILTSQPMQWSCYFSKLSNKASIVRGQSQKLSKLGDITRDRKFCTAVTHFGLDKIPLGVRKCPRNLTVCLQK